MKRLLMLCLVGAILYAVTVPVSAPAGAAALAEEHTVLYYLIEMQRRAKRSCDGAPMPEAPSLMPSETLRSLARAASATGRQAVGQDGTPFFTAFTTGATPRQAVDTLLASQCRAVMAPDLQYIGAYGDNGNWTVVMSARDPDRWVPAEPGQSAPGQSVPGQFAPSRPESGGTPQAGQPASPAPGPPPAQTPHTAAAPEAGAVFSAPGTAREGAPDTATNEPREPATPVEVGAIEIDALGRPVFPPHRGMPSAGPGILPGALPVKPAVGAPAAPAQGAPVQGGPSSGARTAPPSAAGGLGVTPLTDVRSTPPAGDYYVMEPGSGQTVPGQTIPGQAGSGQNGMGQAGTGMTASGLSVPSLGQPVLPSPALPQPALAPSGIVIGTAPVRTTPDAAPDPLALLGLVNEVRARGAVCAGAAMPPVAPLKADARLMGAARRHAEDMAARRYFSSTSPESVTLGQRLTGAGYSWGFLAENIARGASAPGKALESWLASGDQCRNIMDAEYSEAGAGFAPQGSFWVLTFASPMEGEGLRLR